ncbi:MAG: hypothetical protein GQ528_07090 [Woeseiaceae bacterium]|nr:hypothetical protein [Woeseiaceae bacterium]
MGLEASRRKQRVPKAQLDYLNENVRAVNSFIAGRLFSKTNDEHLARFVGGVFRDQDCVARSVPARGRIDAQVSTESPAPRMAPDEGLVCGSRSLKKNCVWGEVGFENEHRRSPCFSEGKEVTKQGPKLAVGTKPTA